MTTDTVTNATIDAMKFNVVVKTFFGGFKPLFKEEFTDLSQAVDFAIKNCDGKKHSMITTFQEGMRDMEFLLLFQKTTNEFTIRTNGKYMDNKIASEVFSTINGHLSTLLKPLPELVILSPEDMQKRWDEHDAEHKAKEAGSTDTIKPEEATDDRSKENN